MLILSLSSDLLLFVTGALSRGHIGPGELLQQRLRCGQAGDALGILEAMDWSIMADECFRGLSSVVNHLLRLELNAEREGKDKHFVSDGFGFREIYCFRVAR